MLGLRRELADRHVLDHAPAQRAYCLVGHGDAPVLSEGCEPLISRQDAPLRYRLGCAASRSLLPRERFSSLALSGHLLIHRRSPLLRVLRTSPWLLVRRRIVAGDVHDRIVMDRPRTRLARRWLAEENHHRAVRPQWTSKGANENQWAFSTSSARLRSVSANAMRRS